MNSVDVIVPCYRYGRFLRECVQSILAQASVTLRVLIIDDASPDNTPEVAADLAKQDSRVNYLRHAANKGHIATYNEGIEWVSADYYLLISADDYLLPGALEPAASLMDAHSEVGFTFGKALEITDGEPAPQAADQVTDRAGSRIFGGERLNGSTAGRIADQTGGRIFGGLEFIELSIPTNLVPGPTVVVRTALQKRLGGYRSELPHSGDMEMWLRLAAHASVGFFDACQACYRRHSSNMSLNYSKHNCLPEFEQRKDAIDWFFERCASNLPNARQLQRRFFRSLSSQAVGRASKAFNEGETKPAAELSQFALRTCPDVKRSFGWLKLACKQRIGSRAWRSLQPALAWARKARFGSSMWARKD